MKGKNYEKNQKRILKRKLKIKEAQAEINRLKNGSKIREAKKRIEEDEKELIRLRQGE